MPVDWGMGSLKRPIFNRTYVKLQIKWQGITRFVLSGFTVFDTLWSLYNLHQKLNFKLNIKFLFQIFVLVILFGLFNGLVFLPVLLGLMGPVASPGGGCQAEDEVANGEINKSKKDLETEDGLEMKSLVVWMNIFCVETILASRWNNQILNEFILQSKSNLVFCWTWRG